jgi:acyl-CoA synthetase (AMP-forming)/AMP-acid ligase II
MESVMPEIVTYRQDVGGWKTRWIEDVAKRSREGGDWPGRTVAEYSRDRALDDPTRVLLVDGGLSVNAGELYTRAQHVAGWFIAQGLKAGDVVSFQLPNWWEAAVINIAAAMIGVVVNPIVPINRDAEVGYMLEESRSRVVFIPETFRKFDYAAMMRRLLPDLSLSPVVVIVRAEANGLVSFDDILASGAPLDFPQEVDPDAVKLLMYTSGTTGRPKGVLHSHNSINADSAKMKPAMDLTEKDITFSPSPVTHVSGYLWALNMPFYGNIPAVMVDSWEPERAFDLIQKHGCTFALGATPFLQDLVTISRRRGVGLDTLRYYLCGGAAVPPSLIYEAAELWPNCIPWRNFGATEVPTMTSGPKSRDDLRLGAETDGRLYRVEVKIVDAVTGAPVASGEEGEILVREPSMALGYARAEDNDAAYDDEGYFRMGDLVRLVDEDHVLCTGRKKDLIIRAGENISAKEIEDILFASPRIEDVAVVSMPSRKTGEAICAFIVAAGDDAPTFAYISALVQEAGLARQKTPEHVQIIEELPKTAAGKIRKDVLRKIAADYAFN